MKKILLSLFSIFMLITGAFVSGCGGGDQVYTIKLESSSFSNEQQNLIEIDLTTEERPTVTIKATVEGQDVGRITVRENSDAVTVTTEYNASLNTNTIIVTAEEEGTAELTIVGQGQKVEEKKVIVYVYSDITGLSQKVDEENKKKTQYIVMDQNIELRSDNYLDITARDTCNRKDIIWSLVENYGNSLSLVDNVLRLNSDYFKAYQTELGEEVNQITIQAQSKFKPEIVTPVTLDVLVGIDKKDVKVQANYQQSDSRFDVFEVIEEEGKEPVYKAQVLELVRSENDDKSTLYYFVDVKTSRDIEWVTLTDEVLYKKFNIPYGTFDITKERDVKDDASQIHSFVFKVVFDNQGVLNNDFSPITYDFNFSFVYKDYDYTYSTDDVKINLIDVVKTIEVTNDANENLPNVEVYNTYANGKGHFFNVSLTPAKAKDTSYFLRLKVAKETAEKMSSYTEYIQVYTESGEVIAFALEEDIVDDNYVYFKSVKDARTRTFANGTRVYAVGQGKYSSDFSLCFYSNAKTNINSTIGINLVYAPNSNFEVTSEDLSKNVESSIVGTTKTITLTCPKLASIDVKDLWLDYEKSENYEISPLRKSLQEISFDVTVKKANINDSFDITLCHKNGYKATQSVNVTFFKALTQASVSLLKTNSSNIAYYKNAEQSFGAGNDNTLNELIVTFGSSVEFSFAHDAGQSLTDDIKIYYYTNGINGVQDKEFDGTVEEEIQAFFDSLDKGDLSKNESAGYMEFISSLSSLRFMTNEATSFTGYVVVEFSGYDADHNPTKIYRIIDVESYVPVSMLSATTVLVETIASDSLSAEDAKDLSNESVVVRFRNDPSTSIPITYYSLVADGIKPYFTIYSATATKDGVSGDYVWDNNTRSLQYKGTTIYSITGLERDGFKMTLDIRANTTSEFVEFVDTLVVEYNSFSSTFRLSIDIKITNSERVKSVIWENRTDDNTLYILLSTKEGLIGENNKQTVITTVSEAYNTDLRFYYAPIGGQSNIIKFEKNGKLDDVVVNTEAKQGGYGYVYILPADSVKENDEISYSYYDLEGNIKTDKIPLTSLNSQKDGQSWFDYLYNNAFYVSNKQEIVRFSDFIIRINVIVADGLSEDTALRIYTGDEIKRITSVNHYVLMNDVSLTMDESMFTDDVPFTGSLRGNDGDEIITMVDSQPIFAYIGKNGAVKDLVFNGTIINKRENSVVGFVANNNYGTIDNVKIDVYEKEDGYHPSSISGTANAGFVGGIAGYSNGTIKNSGVFGLSINNSQNIGGIVGNNNGLIENCKVEMYNFTTEKNKFIATESVGGIVGVNESSSAQITGTYIYDYTLSADSASANLIAPNVGAFVGRNNTTAASIVSKISNSFAVVGIQRVISSGSTSCQDIYISFYDSGVLTSNKTETTSSLWISEGENGFKEYVNGGDSHLTFYQAPAVDINTFAINDDNERFIKVNEDSMILYLYETENQDSLSIVEENALKNKNTYSLQELFGLSEADSECVVVSSSNLYKITTNLGSLQVLDTGSVKITLLSKQDFSKTKEFNVEIIHILNDFKATYKGLKTTGIEVQESRSAQIEFTVTSATYLNSAVLYDLVLDDFVVNTDIPQIKVGENVYAEYSVENRVGTVNVFAGAKNAIVGGAFDVNNYISLPIFTNPDGSVKSGYEGYNEALKSIFEKVVTITPYEGTNNIGVDYASITLYPSLSSQFGATLFTDSETDALHISMKYGDTNLTLSKDGALVPSSVITEDGEYVFSFGSVEKRIVVKVNRTGYDIVNTKYVYSIVLSIHNDYKSSISQTERYTMVFSSANDRDGLLTREMNVVLESQTIDNVDATNYKIETVRNNSGKYTYRKSNTSISLMSPGSSSIFEVTIDPEFSYYEYLTLSYVPQSEGILSLTVMNREADGSYTINTSSNVTNIAYGVKYLPETKKSVYAFRIYVATNISSDCVFPLTVSFFGYDNNGAPKLLGERTYNLYVTCIAQPQVYVNGSEFTKIAKGSTAPVEVTLNTDQELESLTIVGTNINNVFISYNSLVDNGDGTKTYYYNLVTKLTSSVNGGLGQFEIRATVSRTLNGIRESKSMSAYAALVEFDVESVSILGARYDEALGMEVFTAYENITKGFAFDYTFDPESYGSYLTSEEKEIVKNINLKKEVFKANGYYSDLSSFWINYNYDSTTGTYSPIDIMNQLYIVGSNNREQKITWSKLSTQEGEDKYSYIHYDGSYEKFRIFYDNNLKTFSVVGNSTTSAPVQFRLKNITYLASMGTNIYWESSYDFAIEVTAYIDEDSPETINDAKDFESIQEEGEAKPYILMNDIVLENYVPFDTSKILSLDGNGYTIHIKSFDQTAQAGTLNLALFTNVNAGTMLKNLRVNWYNAGQLSIDTSSEGFTNIHIAGLAISNSGIIYNCEVVAYYDEKVNEEFTGSTGIVVEYTRNSNPYYIDGNSAVTSVVSGFVENNDGNITNSRVGGETLRVITDNTKDGEAYYKDIALQTFNIYAQGEVNGFVSKNNKNIASSKVSNIQITNKSTYNAFETAGFVNTNSGSIGSSYVEGKNDGTAAFCYLTTSISSIGYISGFVMTNNASADIENCMTNIVISTSSLFGSGFVYKNEGKINYCFSASQVEQSSYTQMGFTGLDSNGNLVSQSGTIAFSYYYDMKFTGDSNLEKEIDTGAVLVDLARSNSTSMYYGFSFASGEDTDEMLNNADGIWYVREDGKIGIISPDIIAYSVRYIAGTRENNSFIYLYSYMIDNDVESETYGEIYSTQYGSKYNPIIIENANDFDEAMGTSVSTNIKQFYNDTEIFGSYRFVNNIDLDELEKTDTGNVKLSSTTKVLTTKVIKDLEGIGQIDGNGFKIDNISIASSDKSSTGGLHSFGLFARMENGAKVLNLDLGILNVTADDVYVVGGLAGIVANSTVVNVNATQTYTITPTTSVESSDDGILAQNIAGGVIGVVFGQSTVKDVKMENPITQVAFYDSARNNNRYYLDEVNLMKIRTTLLTDTKNLTVLNTLSIAGGIVGFADVFDEDQRTQVNYTHEAEIIEYRIKNIEVNKTVNVRGEVVGGIIGYTTPTVNVENARLRLSVDSESNSLISKILSSNSYAGGIVGLGSGYFYRVSAAYDDATQARIETSYPKYYTGNTSEDDFERGLTDIFYSTYTGAVSYDYKPQVIGGLIGVMINGEIDNSYSKINVIAKPESKTVAGGIIGRVCDSGSTFTFVLNSNQEKSTSASVRLIEVYSAGSVQGGYVVESGKEYGFGGGIVGTLDRNSVLALESVNAVNAFGYEDVVTTAVSEGAPLTGKLSSIGVYAFVGGTAQDRGTIRIIAPIRFTSEGDNDGVSSKSIGYFTYINNANGEKISIDKYPGETKVELIGFDDTSSAIFEIISVSEFADVIAGYNSVLSAFLVGKHWDPTRWKHTNAAIYPEIQYSALKSYYFLDCNNIDTVMSAMQNSDITVYVRGLTDLGTYDDVDLSGKTIVGFSGKFIGPEGWLEEEEIEEGNIAKKNDGEFVGINLKSSLFSGVGQGLTISDLKINYHKDDGVSGIQERNSTGSAFINGEAEEITLNSLEFNIVDTRFNIDIQNGYAGFVATKLINSNIQGIEINISTSNTSSDLVEPYIIVEDDSSIGPLHVGLVAGYVEIGNTNIVSGNTITNKASLGYLLQVNISSKTTANIGGLFGTVIGSENSFINTANMAVNNLIKVYETSATTSKVETLNIGGQIGYVNNISKINMSIGSNVKTDETTSKIHIESSMKTVNYGGLFGKANAISEFNMQGNGTFVNTTLLIGKTKEANANVELDKLYAGGVFGVLSGTSNTIRIETSASTENIKAEFNLGSYIDGDSILTQTTEVKDGQIGGLVGHADSKVLISSVDISFNVGQYNNKILTFDTTQTFNGLCANIGGAVGQNSNILTISDVSTKGTINAQTGGNAKYVGGMVALSSAELIIGSNLVYSSMNICTDAQYIGGIVAYVDKESATGMTNKTKISTAFYDGTIQLFTTNGEITEQSHVVGGIVGFVKVGNSGTVGIVNITNSAFGGIIIASGENTGYENTADGKLLINDESKSKLKLSLTVGGIVGEFESLGTTGRYWYSIANNLSYGDVIVRYDDRQFKKINTYTFGGIVGVANGTDISDNLSLMTNNNPGIATESHVGPIIGNDFENNDYSESNSYSSAVTLCTDDNATDVGYHKKFEAGRTGYGAHIDTSDTAIGLAKNDLTNIIGSEKRTEITNKKGIKLNPYILGDKINPQSPIVYVVIAENGDQTEKITEKITEIEEKASENNKELGEGKYNSLYNIAVVGDGFTIGISNDTTKQTVEKTTDDRYTYSIFKEMKQNDIISSLVVDTNLVYDIPNNAYYGKGTSREDLKSVGGLVSVMNGGIIYASGIYGNISVGGEKLNQLGGLVGNMTMGRIDESYSAVNLIYRGVSDGNVAGFANVNASHNTYISNSFSTGKVETYITANSYAFNSGDVISTIISLWPPKFENGSITISNCYTISQVKVNDHTISSVVTNTTTTAFNFGQSGTYTNCYYDSDTTYATPTNGKGTNVGSGTLAKDYTGNGTVATTALSGWTQAYTENEYFNYGYPTRNFGYLKRTTVVKEGEGANEKTYHLIPNAEKLAQVSINPSWNYRLEYDIDLSQTSSYYDVDPVTYPNEAFINKEFSGIFDGNGKTVNGSQYDGLFMELNGATIQNLRITNADCQFVTPKGSIGILARTSVGETRIRNVVVSGNIKIPAKTGSSYIAYNYVKVGGFVGDIQSGETTVINSKSYANIVSEACDLDASYETAENLGSYLGGFVGYIDSEASGSFENCTNYGPINIKTHGCAGGLVGKTDGTIEIEKSGNTNSILSGYEHLDKMYNLRKFYAAGLVGKITGTYIIDQCYNTAMVKAGNKYVKDNNLNDDYKIASYAAGIVNITSTATAKTNANNLTGLQNCLNQGMIEALSSVEGAKTEYEFVEPDSPSKTKLKIYYNADADDRTRAKIVRVYADSIVTGENTEGEKITCSGFVNEGTIFKNGLYGTQSWETEEIRFVVNESEMAFKERSNVLATQYWNIKDNQTIEIAGNAGYSIPENSAIYQIGTVDEANVYISNTDDLGAPVSFYITVPRKIYYHNGSNKVLTIRQQEIYQYYNDVINDSDTDQTNNSYYNEAKSGQTQSASLPADVWADRSLAFMKESVNRENEQCTTINGEQYSLVQNAGNFLNAMSTNVKTATIILAPNATIVGKEVDVLCKAGYSFSLADVTFKSIDNKGTSATLTASDQVVTSNGNIITYIGSNIRKVYNENKYSLVLSFYLEYNVNDGATYTNPKFTYAINAKTNPDVFTTTYMDTSSVVKEDEKVVIYLKDLAFTQGDGTTIEYASFGLIDGTTYEVQRSDGQVYSMLFNQNEGTLTMHNASIVKDNNPHNWVGKSISFDINQNDNLSQVITSIGMLSKDDNNTSSSLTTQNLPFEKTIEENIQINTNGTIITDGSTEEFRLHFQKTLVETNSSYVFDITKSIEIERAFGVDREVNSLVQEIDVGDIKFYPNYIYDESSSQTIFVPRTNSAVFENFVVGEEATISIGLKDSALYNFVYSVDGEDVVELKCGGKTIALDAFGKASVELDGVIYLITVTQTGDQIQLTAEWSEIDKYIDVYVFDGNKENILINSNPITTIYDEAVYNSHLYANAIAHYSATDINLIGIEEKDESTFECSYNITFELNDSNNDGVHDIVIEPIQETELNRIVKRVYLTTDANGNIYSMYAKATKVENIVVGETIKDEGGINDCQFVTAKVSWSTENVRIEDASAQIQHIVDSVPYSYFVGSNVLAIQFANNFTIQTEQLIEEDAFKLKVQSKYKRTGKHVFVNSATGTEVNNYATNDKWFVGTITSNNVWVRVDGELISYQVNVEDLFRTTSLSVNSNAENDVDVPISVYANSENGNITIHDGKKLSTAINTGISVEDNVDVELESGTQIELNILENKGVNSPIYESAPFQLLFTSNYNSGENEKGWGFEVSITRFLTEKLRNVKIWYNEEVIEEGVSTLKRLYTSEYFTVSEGTFDYDGSSYSYYFGRGASPLYYSFKIFYTTGYPSDPTTQVKTTSVTTEYKTVINYNEGQYAGGTHYGIFNINAQSYLYKIVADSTHSVSSFAVLDSSGVWIYGNLDGSITFNGDDMTWSTEVVNEGFEVSLTGDYDIYNEEDGTIIGTEKVTFEKSSTVQNGAFVGLYEREVKELLEGQLVTTTYSTGWSYDPRTNTITGSTDLYYVTNPIVDGNSCTIEIRNFTSIENEVLHTVSTSTGRAYKKIIGDELFVTVGNLNVENIDLGSLGYEINVTGLSNIASKENVLSSSLDHKESIYSEYYGNINASRQNHIQSIDVQSDPIAYTTVTSDFKSITLDAVGKETKYIITVNYNVYISTTTESALLDSDITRVTIDKKGVILLSDIDLKNSDITTFGIKMSGNNYFINYFVENRSFIPTARKFIKDVNAGGVVYINSDYTSNADEFLGAFVGQAGKDINNVSTYGSIATVDGHYKNLKASGLVGSIPTDDINDSTSYVNFSSFCDIYDGADVTFSYFAGILADESNENRILNCMNYGTIIGYDGADGADGADGETPEEGNPGKNGQSIISIAKGPSNLYIKGTNKNKSTASKGGNAGKGGKGGDGAGGQDRRDGSTEFTPGGGRNYTGEDEYEQYNLGGAHGLNGEVDASVSGTSTTQKAPDGCLGWNGLNLYGRDFTPYFERYYSDDDAAYFHYDLSNANKFTADNKHTTKSNIMKLYFVDGGNKGYSHLDADGGMSGEYRTIHMHHPVTVSYTHTASASIMETEIRNGCVAQYSLFAKFYIGTFSGFDMKEASTNPKNYCDYNSKTKIYDVENIVGVNDIEYPPKETSNEYSGTYDLYNDSYGTAYIVDNNAVFDNEYSYYWGEGYINAIPEDYVKKMQEIKNTIHWGGNFCLFKSFDFGQGDLYKDFSLGCFYSAIDATLDSGQVVKAGDLLGCIITDRYFENVYVTIKKPYGSTEKLKTSIELDGYNYDIEVEQILFKQKSLYDTKQQIINSYGCLGFYDYPYPSVGLSLSVEDISGKARIYVGSYFGERTESLDKYTNSKIEETTN